jgi:hypothetical protein
MEIANLAALMVFPHENTGAPAPQQPARRSVSLVVRFLGEEQPADLQLDGIERRDARGGRVIEHAELDPGALALRQRLHYAWLGIARLGVDHDGVRADDDEVSLRVEQCGKQIFEVGVRRHPVLAWLALR